MHVSSDAHCSFDSSRGYACVRASVCRLITDMPKIRCRRTCDDKVAEIWMHALSSNALWNRRRQERQFNIHLHIDSNQVFYLLHFRWMFEMCKRAFQIQTLERIVETHHTSCRAIESHCKHSEDGHINFRRKDEILCTICLVAEHLEAVELRTHTIRSRWMMMAVIESILMLSLRRSTLECGLR